MFWCLHFIIFSALLKFFKIIGCIKIWNYNVNVLLSLNIISRFDINCTLKSSLKAVVYQNATDNSLLACFFIKQFFALVASVSFPITVNNFYTWLHKKNLSGFKKLKECGNLKSSMAWSLFRSSNLMWKGLIQF